VSLNVSWKRTSGQEFETDLQGKIKTFLAKYGIHQR
jgi:hypothetical protein